ncbi:sodium:calcium antiporter [Methanopyrus sp.]
MTLIAQIAASFGALLLGAWLFTNTVEWIGYRFKLPSGFAGSFIAAVATALPETLVPLVAIVAGYREGVAVGAILGAPLMLSTIAMGVGGLSVLAAYLMGRRRRPVIEASHFSLDARHFLVAYSLVLAASLTDFKPVHFAVAFVLFLLYMIYVRRLLRTGDVVEQPSIRLETAHPVLAGLLAAVFLVGSIVLLVVGAHGFADAVERLAERFGADPFTVSCLLAPIATELPEKLNSVIWYLKGRDDLALGNVTGAMVFQATFPVAVGFLFTSWRLGSRELATVIVPLAAMMLLYSYYRRNGLDWKVMSAVAVLYPVPFVLA